MPFAIKAEVKGVEEAIEALAQIKRSIANRILRTAMRKAAKPIWDAAKSNVAVETGLLKKSLFAKVKTYPSGVTVAVVGPRKGFKMAATKGVRKAGSATAKRFAKSQGRNPTKYAHLVEGGTKPHALGSGSRLTLGRKSYTRAGPQSGRRHPGARAQPFLKPAMDANVGQAKEIIIATINAELAKECVRVRSKRW